MCEFPVDQLSMYAFFKHKSFNSKEEESKLACNVRDGGDYQLVQVLYCSPWITVTVFDWQTHTTERK